MNNLVRISKDNDVAVIRIDNPPVNALSPGVPEAIAAAIDEVNRDTAIRAAVVIGGGRTFVAGADIKEFGRMAASGPRKSLLPLLHYERPLQLPRKHANRQGASFPGGELMPWSGTHPLPEANAAVQPAPGTRAAKYKEFRTCR
jgi:hypothetical protein